MRRNLSYRGGAQRGAGPAATNPQPAGFVATESMQLPRYSLFTPHRYELNMAVRVILVSPSSASPRGRLGVASITPLRRALELAAGRNLEKPFSPQSVASLPQLLLLLLLLLLRDVICDSTECIQTGIWAFLRMPAKGYCAIARADNIVQLPPSSFVCHLI